MPITFEHYLNIRAAYGPAVSPDGSRLAFIATITGVPQVWVMDLQGGWPDPVTSGSDRVLSVAWSPAGEALIFSRDSGGDENAQLFHVSADGSGERPLTRASQAMHLLGAWSADGAVVAYAANRRDPGRYDLYLQELATGAEHLAWQNDAAGFFLPLAFAPGAARRLLVMLMRSAMDHDLFELVLPSGAEPAQLRHLTPHPGEARFLSPAYSADGRALWCATDLGRDRAALRRLDLQSLEWQTVAEPASEIEDVAAAPGGRWLAWAENHDGRHVLRARDLLQALSPIHQADRIAAPLFVIHGRNDPRVPLAEAEQIVAALRTRQVPVEFLVYDDEGHGLVKLANKLDAYPKAAAFLDRYLGSTSAR